MLQMFASGVLAIINRGHPERHWHSYIILSEGACLNPCLWVWNPSVTQSVRVGKSRGKGREGMKKKEVTKEGAKEGTNERRKHGYVGSSIKVPKLQPSDTNTRDSSRMWTTGAPLPLSPFPRRALFFQSVRIFPLGNVWRGAGRSLKVKWFLFIPGNLIYLWLTYAPMTSHFI